jgi:hypothetical protein
MSVKNYRFVSPGVFVNEIDNSQLPASPAGIGPVIIGRAEKGPGLRPTTVNSFEEFVNIFGTPNPGNSSEDVWRQGANTTATTYGMYAAQAYLRNSSPLTYVRLLGAESDSLSTGVQGTGGEAGWDLGGNAYGLFLINSGSAGPSANPGSALTGALAAVIYAKSGYNIALSGTTTLHVQSGSVSTDGLHEVTPGGSIVASDIPIASVGAALTREYKMQVFNGTILEETITFNFTENDSRYIRKVLNTNPQLTNADVTAAPNRKNYFLGETFDRHVDSVLNSSLATYGAISALQANTDYKGADHAVELKAAQTPNVISCRLSPTDNPVNLFKFVARGEAGDWTSKNLKISIQDITRATNDESDYGSFSVVVRLLNDSDNVVRVVEQFNNCNLNPNSLDYVARKIGDTRETWNQTERRYVQAGNYPNNSDYIYIDVNSDVDAGNTAASLLPFGFEGIVKYTDEVTTTTTANWISQSLGGPAMIRSDGDFATVTTGSLFMVSASATLDLSQLVVSCSVVYPKPVFRAAASDGNLANPTDAYFGLQTGKSAGSTVFARSTIDLLRPRGGIVGEFTGGSAAGSSSLSPTFTLDDITTGGAYSTGSYASSSLTYNNGAVSGVLDAGYDRFTIPLFGGNDGLNIIEMDPFTKKSFITSPSETNDYAFFSIKRAVDTISDPEVVEMNLASIPGQTQEGLTTHLVRTCEDRGDALAVIDLPDAFIPREEAKAIDRNNTSSTITNLINGLRSRGLNTSYACTYYPWVRARDTINGAFLWLPPSVAAIGTFSSSQRRTQVWFAPAGFNRGGLTEGSAGIPVVDVAHQLRRKDRDDLYAANINPIAKFPSEGVVIFGQKTLQVTPSALDRINVRRLMIFVKKRISQIAAGILFDPNVKTTWARFTSQVEPFLADVKTNFGLSDYRVVLDDTTTTPDLVDRNILYAQIFLKPTRAIEFIAIDFNITRTGASFDD